LSGQMFEIGAYYRGLIDDMQEKSRNVAEIFLHGRPLERYRRADRDYAADQYWPEKFLVDGLNLTYGHLRSLGCDIMLWARSYFTLNEENAQTTACSRITSEEEEMLANEGGALKPHALLHFLNLLGIFESRANAVS